MEAEPPENPQDAPAPGEAPPVGDDAQPLAPAPAAAGEQPQGDAAPLESGATTAGAYPPEAPEGGGEGADTKDLGKKEMDRAMSYLREVRLALEKDNKGVYDEFMQTMREMKPPQNQEGISVHAVIAKVTELFRGHERLLAGFNQFLPPGYHISAPPTAPGSQEGSRGNSAVRHDAPGAGAGAPEGAAGAPLAYPAGAPGAHGGAAAPDAPPARALPPRAAAPGVAHADPDIDKATRYITKIHQRFGGKFGKKSTYRDFLKLLDDYNKNRDGSGATSSKGIKEVVEKVCKLFYGHQDLLKDFSLFLPDAYQQQAKERIQRAVDAYERERAAAAAAGDEGGGGGARGGGGPGRPRGSARDATGALLDGEGGDGERPLSARERLAERERERGLDRAREKGAVGMGPGRAPRTAALVRKRRGREHEIQLSLTPSESAFFEHVKAALGPREGGWGEFLKCLELYSADVVSRAELLSLCQDVFSVAGTSAGGRLLEELKNLLGARGSGELTPQDKWYTMPIAELDLSASARCTPSYRRLPAGFPTMPCSDRTRSEAEVLNDACERAHGQRGLFLQDHAQKRVRNGAVQGGGRAPRGGHGHRKQLVHHPSARAPRGGDPRAARLHRGVLRVAVPPRPPRAGRGAP